MQKNVNKVVVIVSPIASHQVGYTYVASHSHIHTQLCSANCSCPKQDTHCHMYMIYWEYLNKIAESQIGRQAYKKEKEGF